VFCGVCAKTAVGENKRSTRVSSSAISRYFLLFLVCSPDGDGCCVAVYCTRNRQSASRHSKAHIELIQLPIQKSQAAQQPGYLSSRLAFEPYPNKSPYVAPHPTIHLVILPQPPPANQHHLHPALSDATRVADGGAGCVSTCTGGSGSRNAAFSIFRQSL
jgi:hypothetical protein